MGNVVDQNRENAANGGAPFPPVFHPLPAGASQLEADRHWYSTIYQGDQVPQLTVRAVLTGAIIGMFMSISNLYMTLKVGISFGVAMTACILSYVTWSTLRIASGRRLGQMSILESAACLSTASAAGFSTGSTLSVTFAALLMLDPEHRQQPWWVIGAFTFSTAALGVFLAIPTKRLLINQAQLPFPSGTAAAATLRSLYSRSAESVRQTYALIIALATGVLVGVLSTAEDQFAALGGFFEWMRMRLFDVHLPDQVPAGGFGLLAGKPIVGFFFEPGVVVIGAGMLVGLRVALSMLGASALLYLVVAPWLQSVDAAHAGAAGYVASIPMAGGGKVYHPLRWALWGGASILVFSALTTLALQWRTIGRALSMLRGAKGERGTDGAGDPLATIEVPISWMIAGMVPISLAMVAIQVVAFGIAWWVGCIAVGMCFLLCLVVSRAAGETDLAPDGPMGKVMQLLFAFLQGPAAVGPQASVAMNVVSAGIAANSASAASDLLMDLKTGYLLGANPRKQFLAQFAGVIVGTVVCVPAWFLVVPSLGALEKYPAPAAQVWVAMARALTGGLASLPPSVLHLILIGGAIGVLLPILEQIFPKAKPFLPSPTGLGLGWIVPFSISLSLAIGSAIVAVWRRISPGNQEAFSVPVASGLIAGDSMIRSGLAMLATALGFVP